MHIITGLLMAALIGKKKGNRASPLLNLRGIIRTSHLVDGRVRFHLPTLVNAAEKAEKVRGDMPKIDGIKSVDVNDITGSVLIHYDPDALKPELLSAALIRLLELQNELDKTPRPIFSRELRNMGEALNRAVYERTGGIMDLWTAIPLVLGVIGIRKLMREKLTAFPAGITLVWWAYNALFRDKRFQYE